MTVLHTVHVKLSHVLYDRTYLVPAPTRAHHIRQLHHFVSHRVSHRLYHLLFLEPLRDQHAHQFLQMLITRRLTGVLLRPLISTDCWRASVNVVTLFKIGKGSSPSGEISSVYFMLK